MRATIGGAHLVKFSNTTVGLLHLNLDDVREAGSGLGIICALYGL